MLTSQNELAPRKRRNEQITIHKEYAHNIAQTSPLWIVAVQGQFWEWLRLALFSSNGNCALHCNQNKHIEQNDMEPFMIYTGNHLFHYTKFDSALKIIATNSIRYGDFSNMNDIAEVKREVYGMIPPEAIETELEKYRSISLTLDNPSRRGFSIDPLWGHYAQNGNGVCLVFDKEKMIHDITTQFGRRATVAPIEYLHEFTNAIFTEGDTREDVEKHVEKCIDDIFFTKSIDWEYEHELRILIKDNGQHELLHLGNDTLMAAILCLPKEEKYEETVEFKILKTLLGEKPVLHYTTSLGNKELLGEDGEKVCGIIGIDWQLHLDWNDIK